MCKRNSNANEEGNLAVVPSEADSSKSAAVTEPSERHHFESSLWLAYHDQRFVSLMLVFAIAALAACWFNATEFGFIEFGATTAKRPSYQYRININSASWYEFALLAGMGPSYSKRIVEYRETNGAFESIDELKRVRGIGEHRLERMRPWLTLDDGAVDP